MRARVWLIACECSGAIRSRMRAMGIEAWSCDLKPAEDGSEYHIQDDVRHHLHRGWGGVVAHPECKFMSVSGLHWNKRGAMVDGRPRAELTEEALDFVRELMAAPVPLIAIENPVSCISTRIRKPDQIVQPYEFGDDASKKTCLWLKGLPPLTIDPAKRLAGRMVEWPRGSGRMVERWANQTDSGQNRIPPSASRATDRSRTYPGIADAIARQWGPLTMEMAA